MTASRKIVAFLALLCLLGITTVSALPAHGHENDPSGDCDICHYCLQPVNAIQLCPQMPMIWRQPSEAIRHCPTSAQ